MRKKVVRGILFGIAVFAPLSVLALRQAPRLLQQSARVVRLPPGHDFREPYQWVAPNEILALLDTDDFRTGRFKVARIRTDTGTVTFLKRNNAVTKDLTRCAFSPDGKWYLGSTWGDHGIAIYLCAADESKQIQVYRKANDGLPWVPAAWTGDSRHWLSMLGFSSEPVEYRTFTNASGPKIDISALTESVSLILTSDPQHRILQSSFDDKKVSTLAVCLCNLNAPATSDRFRIPLPVPGRVMEVAVSPNGNHLAWLLHVQSDLRVYDRICRYVRFLPRPPSRDTYQIWTTTLKGDSPRLLGMKDITVRWDPGTGCFGPGWQHEGGVHDVAWTSDASAVSFSYQNALYTVAAK